MVTTIAAVNNLMIRWRILAEFLQRKKIYYGFKKPWTLQKCFGKDKHENKKQHKSNYRYGSPFIHLSCIWLDVFSNKINLLQII